MSDPTRTPSGLSLYSHSSRDSPSIRATHANGCFRIASILKSLQLLGHKSLESAMRYPAKAAEEGTREGQRREFRRVELMDGKVHQHKTRRPNK